MTARVVATMAELAEYLGPADGRHWRRMVFRSVQDGEYVYSLREVHWGEGDVSWSEGDATVGATIETGARQSYWLSMAEQLLAMVAEVNTRVVVDEDALRSELGQRTDPQ
jgi:hypothetical protein